MNIEQKRRESFEAWAESRGLDLYCSRTDLYEDAETLWAWSAWRAALDAVVIELPPEDERGRITRTGAIRAIESTGLGLKVLP